MMIDMENKSCEYEIADSVVIYDELEKLLPEPDENEYYRIKESIREKGYDVSEGGRIILWIDDSNSETADVSDIPPHVLV